MSSFGAQLRGVLQALVANRLIIATAMVSNVLFSKFCRFHFSYKSLLKNASKSQFLELGRRDIRFWEAILCACGAQLHGVLQSLVANRLIVLARRCSCVIVRCVVTWCFTRFGCYSPYSSGSKVFLCHRSTSTTASS